MGIEPETGGNGAPGGEPTRWDLVLQIDRVTVQPGRTFSAEAIRAAGDVIVVRIGELIRERWEETGEPPTALTVRMRVDLG